MGKEEIKKQEAVIHLFPSERREEERPRTLLEILFESLDSVARAIANWMPLGRKIRAVMSSPSAELIGWDDSREIAFAVIDMQKAKPEPISTEITDQYQNMLEAANEQTKRYTGLDAPDLPDRVYVFTQKEWVEANIPSFQFLFEPISDNYFRFIDEAGNRREYAGRLTHGLLTVQVGIIMGYLARNVLGQFDLSLPEPEKGTRLYVIEPNIRRVETQLLLDPREFRQWITLHEATHSLEFHSNPWLKDYLTSTLREYMKGVTWRVMSGPQFLRNFRGAATESHEGELGASLIAMISTPEQRQTLSRLHAVMCLLEGYSNHVMDSVGKELLPTYDLMKERFERRRQMKTATERLFQRLLGVNLKLEQYRLGESFVNEVVRSRGIAFLNRVWNSPEMLPTLQEIRKPEKWIDRVDGAGDNVQA